MTNYYGQIDLTKLGQIVKKHPELVKVITFKDGEHKLLDVSVNERQQVGQHGEAAYVKVKCKKDEQREGLNYYVGDLKVSTYGQQQQGQQTASTDRTGGNAPAAQPAPAPAQQQIPVDDDLPF